MAATVGRTGARGQPGHTPAPAQMTAVRRFDWLVSRSVGRLVDLVAFGWIGWLVEVVEVVELSGWAVGRLVVWLFGWLVG